VSWLAEEVTVGAFILAGTVVAVTSVGADGSDVPEILLAVIVTEYKIPEVSPVTTRGDDDPLTDLEVCPEADAITV
jgi:hypothetical protein